ncbi:tubby, partial [Thraustotheca clavata]
MFMQETSFEDDDRGKRVERDLAKDVENRLNVNSPHPNMLDDDEIEEIGGPVGSRSNVIQQQRDLHKKKMQERMSGGVVRTTGARQFSTPRSVDIDEKPSRFGRDDDFIDERSSGKIPARFKRDEEDEEDNDDDSNSRRRSTTKKSNRSWRDESPEEDRRKSKPAEKNRRKQRAADSDEDDDDQAEYDRRPSMNRRGSRNDGDGYPERERNKGGDTWVENTKAPKNRKDEGNDDTAVSTFDPDKGKPKKAAVKKGKLDLMDMKAFLLRPVPKACDVVECYIERNRSGSNKMFPEYCLYLKDGDRFLLTAKKRPNNRTSNYLISMQLGDLARKGSDNFLGKLRANFIGTEFVIYDNGVNPKNADQHTLTVNPAGIRQELGIAVYAKNVLGHRGPRKMKVCVPRVREDGTRVVWRPVTKEDEMINKCKEQDHTNLTYLINKPPRWNDQVGAYVLNFNGRVTMASVILQFGRVGKELFTMDFRAPLCPLQAFAITLSSFDSKLACE